MNFGGESMLAAGVTLLAVVALPLLAHAVADLFRWESEPVRAVGSAAIVMGCLGMCGLVWGPILERGGWLVSLLALVLLKIGLGLIVVFTWRTFRPQSTAAALVTGSLLLLLTVSLYLDLQTVRTDGSYPENTLGFRLGQLATSLPFLWLGLESAQAHRAYTRAESSHALARYRGGGFGAWSVASLVFFSECLASLVRSLFEDERWLAMIDGTRGLLYAIGAVCLYSAFYAPAIAARRARQRTRHGARSDSSGTATNFVMPPET